jgi:hypothetical protein
MIHALLLLLLLLFPSSRLHHYFFSVVSRYYRQMIQPVTIQPMTKQQQRQQVEQILQLYRRIFPWNNKSSVMAMAMMTMMMK